MFQYALQRTLLAIPTLLGITLISFLIMHLAPGDPVDLFLGGAAGGEGISTDRQSDFAKTRRDLRRQLGLDKPLHVQYLSWLSGLILRIERLDNYDRMAIAVDQTLSKLDQIQLSQLQETKGQERKGKFLAFHRQLSRDADVLVQSSFWKGKNIKVSGNYRYEGAGLELWRSFGFRFVTLNFGRSFKDQQPVIKRILARLPVTVEINVLAILIAYVIGVPLGILLALKQDSRTDRLLTSGTFVLWSMPSFWVGMLLITFFCNREFLFWFPASGIQSLNATEEWGTWRLFKDHAHHMVLPVLASSYSSFAVISRFMRTSMLENLRLDYVRTAQAKGLGYNVVVLRHVLRNSLIPIVTLLAGLLPGLFAGSVFIETIFTVPGLGFLGFQSVIVRDYPVIMAIFTISAALFLFGILLADILLKAVDPRIEFSQVEG